MNASPANFDASAPENHPSVSESLDREIARSLARKRAREIADWLRSAYPAAFAAPRTRPLAVGTHLEIRRRHPELEPGPLALALRWHCRAPHYIRGIARKGSHRYDLDGNPVEPVSDEDRASAVKWAESFPVKKPTAAPSPAPEPPPPPIPNRQILRLKPKPGPVVAVTVTRRTAP